MWADNKEHFDSINIYITMYTPEIKLELETLKFCGNFEDVFKTQSY